MIVQRAVTSSMMETPGGARAGNEPRRCRSAVPLCRTEVVRPGGVMHRCPNRGSPRGDWRPSISWVGAALDIESRRTRDMKSWDEGIVRSLPDLYRLTAGTTRRTEGFAEISGCAWESIAPRSSRLTRDLGLRRTRKVGDRPQSLRCTSARRRRWPRPRSSNWAVEGIGPSKRSSSPNGSPIRRGGCRAAAVGLQLELAEDERLGAHRATSTSSRERSRRGRARR